MAKRSTASVVGAMAFAAVVAAIGSVVVGILAFPWAMEQYDQTAEVAALFGIMGVTFAGLWLVTLGFIFGISD